jgi:protein-histidine pros-kinase
MSRRLKFNALIAVVLAIGVAVAGFFIHGVLHRDARDGTVQTANLLMAAAEATRSYTTAYIKPQLDQRLAIEFLPQTVPAFAATETIIALRKQFPEYTYKEATLNPTNPRDRTTDWEADVVNAFRADAALKEIVGERTQGPIQALYIAKPIKISNPTCLGCHSTPSAAPPSMIRLYGEANGFGWKQDEIIGAQIVSVPLSIAAKSADRTFILVLGALVVLALLALGVGNLLLGAAEARKTE